MPDFAKAFENLISIEGGYVNDKFDRGGETKFGICKQCYPNLDIKNLTLENAKRIYRRDYWDRLKLNDIKNQAVAEEIFDTGVNCGSRTAARFLQEALNILNGSGGKPLVVDGIIGSKTIRACNQYRYPKALLKAMNGLQFVHYLEIIKRDPEQERFFRGWLTRVWEHN